MIRNVMRLTTEEVVEFHKSCSSSGLSIGEVSSLRRIHGLNKFNEEDKVWCDP